MKENGQKLYVRVNFKTTHDRYAERETVDVLVAENSQIKDLLDVLEIQPSDIGLILMDKKLVNTGKTITDGAVIDIYPIIAGG